MSVPNWRSAESYSYILELAPQEIAWEFLRRNPDYRSCFDAAKQCNDDDANKPAQDWGLRFLADPALNALETSIFWRPEACAFTVILDAGACVTSENVTLSQDLLRQAERRGAKEGQHILLRKAGYTHQIFLTPRAQTAQQLHAVIPFDNYTTTRIMATSQLWRMLMKRRTPLRYINTQRKHRHLRSLRALDANVSGASHRDIAQHLFPLSRQDTEAWRVSSMRAAVRRLVETGMTLMHEDYRDLLKGAPLKGGRK